MSSGRGRPRVADSGPAMNSWKDQSLVGWWRMSSAWWTSAARKTRFLTPRVRNAFKIASRSVTKPVPLSAGMPNTLASVHESRRAGRPVGTASGTLVTTTFHSAVDAVTPSTSQRRCAAPSIVLPGPSSRVALQDGSRRSKRADRSSGGACQLNTSSPEGSGQERTVHRLRKPPRSSKRRRLAVASCAPATFNSAR